MGLYNPLTIMDRASRQKNNREKTDWNSTYMDLTDTYKIFYSTADIHKLMALIKFNLNWIKDLSVKLEMVNYQKKT